MLSSSKVRILFFLLLALTQGVSAQTVRVIDNKGTINEIYQYWTKIGSNGDIHNTNTGNVGIGTGAITPPAATLHNAGSTILGSTALSNFTANTTLPVLSTVDAFSGAVITQTTAGILLALPDPTDKTPGRIFQVSNSNTSVPITVGGVTLAPGSSTLFRWDGVIWNTLTVSSSSLVRNNITTGTSFASATDPLTLGGSYTNALVGGSNASFAVNNTAPLWNANQLRGIDISTTVPVNGQILGYNGTNWSPVSQSMYAWLLTGNGGTTSPAAPAAYGTTPLASTENWIGTTGANDFVVGTKNIERLRFKSDGSIGIGTTSPAANTLLTINPTTDNFRNGISLTLTGASSPATGISINSSTSKVNGLLVTNSSGATTDAFYGVGSILNSGNSVSGYMGYRNSSGMSYGLYGVNGTTIAGGYATSANTYAAFFQGRTVISSDGSPSSPVGVDLEIQNTTVGPGNPVTLSMRQTTQNTTSGTSLAKINFGDSYSVSNVPQAQIQALRDAAGGASNDLPTALTFSTTPDGSATIAERMRISNAGNVGIGTTSPSTLLHINSVNNPAFRLVDGTQGAGKILTSDANGNAAWSGISSIGSISLSTGTASTAPAWSVSPVSLGGSTQLNIPMANTSSVTAGLISNLDWTTFNSKIGSVIGSSPITVTTTGTMANVSVGYDNSTIKVNGSNQLYAVNTGTVRNFSAGDLSPLFTTAEATTTTTPALSFTLNTQSPNSVFAGPSTGSTAVAPTFRSLVIADLPTAIPNGNLANSSITINGNSVSLGGSTTVTANTPNSITFNNGGSGAASGATFNGSAAQTISYNTIGAQAALSGTGYVKQSGTSTSYVSKIPLTSDVTGVLPVANGGTGLSAMGTPNQVLAVNSAGTALNWVTPTTGTITSIATNSGLTGGTITTSGTIGIATNGVTNALFRQSSANTLVGNPTNATANVTDINIGSGLSFSGTTLNTVNNGTVTQVTSGNLSPLFTTSVATNTTTPAISYALTNTDANTIFGNNTGASAAPSYFSSGSLAISGDVTGTLGATTVAKLRGVTVSTTLPTTTGQVLAYNSTTSQWEPAANSGSGWLLTGNAGTTPGTNFLGTTDDKALVIKVNGQPSGLIGSVNSFGGQTNLGYNASTGSQYSTAIGAYATASSSSGVALGYQSTASDQYTIAIGGTSSSTTEAKKTYATAIGSGAKATEQYTVALGGLAQATATNATAIGYNTTADHTNTVILGNGANVGIGTTNPTTLLHINGATSPAFRLVDGTQGAGKVLVSDANGNASWSSSAMGWSLMGNTGTTPGTNFMGTTDNKDVVFKTNSTEAMRLSASDQTMGLGTALNVNSISTNFKTNKFAFVDENGSHSDFTQFVYGGIPVYNLLRANGSKSSPSTIAPNDDNIGRLVFGAYNGTDFVESATLYTYTDGAPSKGRFEFRNDGTTKMVIKASGNVGIGTTTPNSTFQVSGSVSLPITTITASTTLDEKNYTIIANNFWPITITLPSATTCQGRIYIIKRINSSISISSYYDSSNNPKTSIDKGVTQLQSDGTNWQQIN